MRVPATSDNPKDSTLVVAPVFPSKLVVVRFVNQFTLRDSGGVK